MSHDCISSLLQLFFKNNTIAGNYGVYILKLVTNENKLICAINKFTDLLVTFHARKPAFGRLQSGQNLCNSLIRKYHI